RSVAVGPGRGRGDAARQTQAGPGADRKTARRTRSDDGRRDPPEAATEGDRFRATGSMRASEETVRQRLDDLIAGFDEYASRFDSAVSVDDDRQFGTHRRTIQRRRELGSIEAAIEDEAFVELLYRTIQQWGIGRRGSRIVPLPTFHASLRAHRSALMDLDRLSIESNAFEVASIGAALDDLVANLSIVENRARIVAATKTLHHLLPD